MKLIFFQIYYSNTFIFGHWLNSYTMAKLANSKSSPDNKWIKRLQQESWELELLISGFSILMLIKCLGWLNTLIDNVSFNYIDVITIRGSSVTNFINPFLAFISLAVYVLVVNLVIHFFLRGFWVGVVGLGSVAPKTDLKKLKYSNYFIDKIKKRLYTLDELVIALDNISSVIFSFSYLIVFYMVSMGIYFVFFIIIMLLMIIGIEISPAWIDYIILILVSIVILSSLLYLIDFLTFGIFRKRKIISKIFYPIYRFYSIITLSSIYRTIYYNLITRYSKRRMSLLLLSYLIVFLFLATTRLDHYLYFPDNETELNLKTSFYSNMRETDTYIKKADIPSNTISGDYLQLFIRYDVDDNLLIKEICNDYKPEKKGLKSGIKVGKGSLSVVLPPEIEEDEPEKALECLSQLYSVYLNDSLIPSLKYYFFTHPNRQEKGIITMLDISHLEKGENIINIYKRTKIDSEREDYAHIPFWVK